MLDEVLPSHSLSSIVTFLYCSGFHSCVCTAKFPLIAAVAVLTVDLSLPC